MIKSAEKMIKSVVMLKKSIQDAIKMTKKCNKSVIKVIKSVD